MEKDFQERELADLFQTRSGKSNASALYIPCNSRLRIRGKGEVAFFEAPALKEKPPFFLSNQKCESVSRGEWVWRRNVTPLISPKNASSNLVVGETYSPRVSGQGHLFISTIKISPHQENRVTKRSITTGSIGK